jgi:Fur family transcriptional regulator, ferric uptake regulator
MTRAEVILKKSGLRVTQHRLLVLDWLSIQKGPVTLLELNRKFADTINRITLYRILNDLSEIKAIKLFFGQDGHKYIEQATTSTGSDGKVHPSHFHFQCNQCEHVYCLDDILVKNLPTGFNLSMEQSVLIGICEQCHDSDS